VCPSLPRTVCTTTPIPDPCTVIDADPVPAWFNRRILLSPAVSADHSCVTLPPRAPAVITTRRDPPGPCPTRHRTDVSDSHTVPSHPVCPVRPRAVCATTPMLDPCTVIDADPAAARFTRRILLSLAVSRDQIWLTLPPRAPTVITTRRVPPDPCPTGHRTDVSDCHCVASHPVCPSLPLSVKATNPILDPCTVIDADPVPAWFTRSILLTDAVSTDQPCVKLPPRDATVITTRRDPAAPCPTRHRTDVSDCHTVPSHPVCPHFPRTV
jgi:hypothetical protein